MGTEIGITGVVETAAVVAGFCVKKGTAEQGIVVAGAGERCKGIVRGNVVSSESFAVGAQASVSVLGIVPAICGQTITADQDLKADSVGKLVPITAGGTSVSAEQRVAVALDNGLVDEAINVLVKLDVV